MKRKKSIHIKYCNNSKKIIIKLKKIKRNIKFHKSFVGFNTLGITTSCSDSHKIYFLWTEKAVFFSKGIVV